MFSNTLQTTCSERAHSCHKVVSHFRRGGDTRQGYALEPPLCTAKCVRYKPYFTLAG
jgi:hypothetical protein